MREKIKLSGVPETMLQILYARAKESRGRGAIHDAKAEEIIEKLDYDFSLAGKESIDASNAKFNWGIKNGKALAELLPGFRFVEEHSLMEGMAAFAPVYKLLDRLPAVRNISNKIIVLEKE